MAVDAVKDYLKAEREFIEKIKQNPPTLPPVSTEVRFEETGTVAVGAAEPGAPVAPVAGINHYSENSHTAFQLLQANICYNKTRNLIYEGQ